MGGSGPVSRRRVLIGVGLGAAGVAAGGLGAAAWFAGLGVPAGGFEPADTGARLGQPEVIASRVRP